MTPPVETKVCTEELALRLRRHVVRMCCRGRSAHVGSCLSMADIAAVLYGEILKLDPADPFWPERDRFILSKGHAGACVYAALAERGFFAVKDLDRHYENGSNFSGHVSHTGIPGVEISTGSLGHGLGLGAGMALQLRRTGGTQRVFVMLGDGECDEGSVWEAAMFAAHHRLSKLCAIIDYNKLQSLAAVDRTIGLEPLVDKWQAFGWEVRRVNGHNHAELRNAFRELSNLQDRPGCIVADTVKGAGVSFMENQVLWHYRVPQGEEFEAAMRELAAGPDSADA